jgi:hypothetical protein
MKARDKFQKRKERERAVRKKVLVRRQKMRAEFKEIKKLQREEELATTRVSPELGNLLADLKKNENSEV